MFRNAPILFHDIQRVMVYLGHGICSSTLSFRQKPWRKYGLFTHSNYPPVCYDLLTPKCPFCNLLPTKIGTKCAKVVKIGGGECVDWSGYAVGELSIFVPSRVIGVRFFPRMVRLTTVANCPPAAPKRTKNIKNYHRLCTFLSKNLDKSNIIHTFGRTFRCKKTAPKVYTVYL
jgi:hypothetical protein